MAEDLKITNNTNSKDYLIYGGIEFTPIQTQKSYSFQLPEGAPEDNQIIRLEGQLEEMNITFNVWNNGIDRANGTHSSTVKTVAEQLIYLRETIFTKAMSDSWTLVDSVEYPSGINGIMNEFRRRRVAGNPNVAEATIHFERGTVL